MVVRGTWPTGEIAHGEGGAAYAQAVAVRIRDAIGNRSLREVERETAVPAMTLAMVLQGRGYASIQTLARIERALGCSIIPDYSERRRL